MPLSIPFTRTCVNNRSKWAKISFKWLMQVNWLTAVCFTTHGQFGFLRGKRIRQIHAINSQVVSLFAWACQTTLTAQPTVAGLCISITSQLRHWETNPLRFYIVVFKSRTFYFYILSVASSHKVFSRQLTRHRQALQSLPSKYQTHLLSKSWLYHEPFPFFSFAPSIFLVPNQGRKEDLFGFPNLDTHAFDFTAWV